jgi:hypothetical protein
MHRNVCRPSCKVVVRHVQSKCELSDQFFFFFNSQIKFHKNFSSGSWVFPCIQMDKWTNSANVICTVWFRTCLRCSIMQLLAVMQYFSPLDRVHLYSWKASFSGKLSLCTPTRSFQFLLLMQLRIILFFLSVFKYSYWSSCEEGCDESFHHVGTWEPVSVDTLTHVGFEVLTAVNMKSSIFWVAIP